MRHSALPYFFFLIVLAIAIILACGSSHRYLESVTVSPASGEGQVQFIASGYYTTQPSPVTPLTATWGACYQNQPTTGVSVSANGLAQCATGSVGNYTVWAFVVSQPPPEYACPDFLGPCGTGGCLVTGTAQLTCP